MDKMQALHTFWSGFTLTAYDENTVPDDAALPYITYSAISDDFGHNTLQTASIYYRSNSWADVTKKEQEIAEYITRGGRLVPFDYGSMWIKKGSPWAQRLADTSNYDIRRIVLNVEIEFFD